MKREYTAKRERLPYKICYVRLSRVAREHGGGHETYLWHEVAPDCKITLCHIPVQWFSGESWRVMEVRHLDYVPSDRCIKCALGKESAK